MKRDYYEVLGVAKTATDDDIKKAFRRLSSAHHPDKHTQAPDAEKAEHEAKFKEAKEAYETLSDPQKRAAYDQHGHAQPQFQQANWGRASQSEIDDILNQLRRAHGMGGFNRQGFRQVAEFNARVTLAEAAKGFEVDVAIPGRSVKVKVRPNTPDGYRTRLDLPDGLSIIATTRIHDPGFEVPTASDAAWRIIHVGGRPVTLLETGNIGKVIEVDALDILAGAWVNVSDHLGATFQLRIPAGLGLGQKIKLAGKGYYHWLHDLDRPSEERGDLFVTVKPIFNGPLKLDKEKVKALLAAVEAAQPDAAV